MLIRNGVQGVEVAARLVQLKPEAFWHYWDWCAPAPGSPPVPQKPSSTLTPHNRTAVFPRVRAVMWSAVLPVNFQHRWVFVCGKEKIFLSPSMTQKSLSSVSETPRVCFFLFSLLVHSCVNAVKYSIVNKSRIRTGTRSHLRYLQPFQSLFIERSLLKGSESMLSMLFFFCKIAKKLQKKICFRQCSLTPKHK